jgi:hypothetical protein
MSNGQHGSATSTQDTRPRQRSIGLSKERSDGRSLAPSGVELLRGLQGIT